MNHAFSSFFTIIFSLVCLLNTHQALAGQIPVTSTNDSGPGSLRAAIDDANAGDTLYFTTRGTILLESHLPISKDLTIMGPGPDSLILDGQNKKRIMDVDSAIHFSVSGITFTRGNAIQDQTDIFPSGGAIRSKGFVNVETCIFTDNAASYGGAIDNWGSDSGNVELFLRQCTFIRNDANPGNDTLTLFTKSGGAILTNGLRGGKAKVRAVNCTFTENIAGFGGGAIQILQDQGDSTISLHLSHCTIAYNIARDAAGVDVSSFGLTRLKNTIIANNLGASRNPDFFGNATSEGGLLIGTIEFNSSIGYTPGPGDLMNVDPEIGPLDYYGGPTPTHSLLCKSPAVDGGVSTPNVPTDQRGRNRIGAPDMGAVERDNDFEILITSKDNSGVGSLRSAVANACPNDTLDLTSLAGTIKLTSAITLDKALHLEANSSLGLWITASGPTRIFEVDTQVTASMRYLTLAYGRPDQFGGGAILNRGSLKVEACTFFKNTAISGGAIGNFGDGGEAVLEAINCTFSGNSATLLDGGAVDNYQFTHATTASFRHCTFTNNQAEKRGGAIYNQADATVNLYNSLMGGDSARTGNELYGSFNSLGHNLIADDSDATLNGGSGDILNQDPMLGTLQYHGGPNYTHQLLNGSPAIDAGDNTDAPDTDQRGYPRVFNNTIDIGAYEFDPATGLQTLTETQFSVYPNPNSGSFYLQLDADLTDLGKAQLLDLQGRIIWQQEFVAPQASERLKIEAPGISPGIYILQVLGKRWQGSRKILIK